MEPTDRDWIGVIGLRLVETLESKGGSLAELVLAVTQAVPFQYMRPSSRDVAMTETAR
jgi:hypothetical protein